MLGKAHLGLEMNVCSLNVHAHVHTIASEGSVGMVTLNNQMSSLKHAPPVLSCKYIQYLPN